MQEILAPQFEGLKFNLLKTQQIEFHSAQFWAVYKYQQLTEAGIFSGSIWAAKIHSPRFGLSTKTALAELYSEEGLPSFRESININNL